MRPALHLRSVPAEPKVLRVGLVLGDRIVEERIVPHGTITVGQSPKCTIWLPIAELPRTWTLFSLERRGWRLRVAPWMHAHLANDPGDGLLTDKTRGRVTIGPDATILFQFVTAPVAAPKPRLPASLRRRRIDPWLAVIVGASLAAHLAAFAYFKWARAGSHASEAKLYEEVVLSLPRPQPPTPPTPPPAPIPSPNPNPNPTPSPSPVAHRPPAPTPTPSPAPYHFDVAGFLGHSGAGTFTDLANGKASFEDLDIGLAHVGNHPVAIASTTDAGIHTQAPSSIADPNADPNAPVVGPHDPGRVAPAPVDRPVVVDPPVVTPIDAPAGFDPSVVTSKIKQTYQAGVMACYERELKETPGLQGKLSLTFTVGVAGNVTSASADGLVAAVDTCVEKTSKSRWRFAPAPHDEATFQIEFVMRPGR
jgi:hypothetical protein